MRRTGRARDLVERAPVRSIAAPLTTLIGRSREIEAITEQLRRSRLVTVTGPGGVGKTRLAVEVARRRAVQSKSVVRLVDLATVAPGADVAAETARTLDITGAIGTAALGALQAYLAERDVLLVLDNCEHVVDPCAELATALLARSPGLRVLATSREPLGVDGEVVWTLRPLERAEAVRLFVDRASHRRPGFVPTQDDDAAITQLCHRLDCLPLAIELAAGRVNVMSPAEIAASLDDRRVELRSVRRQSPPHHRSVRATVEWSYELLDPDEQDALRSYAAFVGTFDVAAAQSVAPHASLDVFARLVDKSLVTVVDVVDVQGERTRYRLLETVRQYAEERLAEAGEADDARARHLRHYSTATVPTPDGWPASIARQVLDALENDYDNIRGALEWAAEADPCGGLQLVDRTGDLFFMLGHADGLRLARTLLGRCPTIDRCRVRVLITAGVLALVQSAPDSAKRTMAEAHELAVQLEDRGLQGWALLFAGLSCVLGGEIVHGRQLLDSARAIHQEVGDAIGEARSTAVLGLAAAMEGDVTRSRELVEAALDICVAHDDGWGQGHCHTYLGIVSGLERNGEARATMHFRTAVEQFRPYRDTTLLPVALLGQAQVVLARDPARALRIAAAVSALRARGGHPFPPFFQARAEQVRTAAEQAVGGEAPLIWRQGTSLDIDEAIRLAFGTKATRPASASGLTSREAQVARLVADGKTNKEIGAHLHLSVRTIESHVRSALTKLSLTNRTQLATWARDRMT